MIPAPFEYEVAESVDHAVELLGFHEDAKLLAGGHSLVPLLKLRVTRPAALIDVGRLHELRYVRDAGDTLAIGALSRHHDLVHDPLLQEHCPIVPFAAAQVGDPQVRHRGTIGGSLAHGDPASDLPAVALALDAELTLQGPEGTRTVAARDFFQGVFQTALEPGDVLVEIRVPKLTDANGWSFLKFHRRAQDWATVGVAAVTRQKNGAIDDAAIGLVNMGATPLRAAAVEAALRGAAPDAVAEAAELAAEGTEPPSDTAASAEYRRHLARVLTRRALQEALGP